MGSIMIARTSFTVNALHRGHKPNVGGYAARAVRNYIF